MARAGKGVAFPSLGAVPCCRQKRRLKPKAYRFPELLLCSVQSPHDVNLSTWGKKLLIIPPATFINFVWVRIRPDPDSGHIIQDLARAQTRIWLFNPDPSVRIHNNQQCLLNLMSNEHASKWNISIISRPSQIPFRQCCGSMTCWGGSGSGFSDPCLRLMDPNSDPYPAIFVIDLQDASKKLIF